MEPVDCNRVIEYALADSETSIEQDQAKITADPLPMVMGELGQLTQVFENLLGNGIEFHGEVSPRIHVSAERDSDFWQFSVSDNGIGIEPQYWERIFLIVERLHERTAYPGTGIGLAITRKIIERHGGHIWVKSEYGAGTQFLFTLPIVNKRMKNGKQQPD